MVLTPRNGKPTARLYYLPSRLNLVSRTRWSLRRLSFDPKDQHQLLNRDRLDRCWTDLYRSSDSAPPGIFPPGDLASFSLQSRYFRYLRSILDLTQKVFLPPINFWSGQRLFPSLIIRIYRKFPLPTGVNSK